MATWSKRKLTCGCCGATFTADILQSNFSSRDSYALDLNPHNASGTELVTLCPSCGYASMDIEKKIDDLTARIVKSAGYVGIVHRQMDDTTRKNCLAAVIAETKEEYREAASCYLSAAWSEEKAGRPSNAFRKQANTCLKKHLDVHADLSSAIQFVDSLRRLKEFEDAADTAEYLLSYSKEAESAVLNFEIRLSKLEDSAEHFLREVQS